MGWCTAACCGNVSAAKARIHRASNNVNFAESPDYPKGQGVSQSDSLRHRRRIRYLILLRNSRVRVTNIPRCELCLTPPFLTCLTRPQAPPIQGCVSVDVVTAERGYASREDMDDDDVSEASTTVQNGEQSEETDDCSEHWNDFNVEDRMQVQFHGDQTDPR